MQSWVYIFTSSGLRSSAAAGSKAKRLLAFFFDRCAGFGTRRVGDGSKRVTLWWYIKVELPSGELT